MGRILIVNADDFGLSRGQNYGIVEACRHGVVTSTTALVNGAAAEHAASLRNQVPEMAIGLHFTLTLGQPLGQMPGIARNGQLGKWLWELAAEDRLPLDEVLLELERQYARFIVLFGGAPTHIDSHHHVHMLPALFPLVAEFARQKGVALRIDRDVAQRDELPTQALKSSDAFSSIFYSNTISSALFCNALDAADTAGSLEIMCHPAFIDRAIMASNYCYPRLDELVVLTQPALRWEIAERGFRLGTFSDL